MSISFSTYATLVFLCFIDLCVVVVWKSNCSLDDKFDLCVAVDDVVVEKWKEPVLVGLVGSGMICLYFSCIFYSS